MGVGSARAALQVDSVDANLTTALWNAFNEAFYHTHVRRVYDENQRRFNRRLWSEVFKQDTDDLPYDKYESLKVLKEEFFGAKWWRKYDFIEIAAEIFPHGDGRKWFMQLCNRALESEKSAYRFVGNRLARLTSENEIAEVQAALDAPLPMVSTHIKRALELFSDRKSPDYRNSIKESISAVEAACKILAKQQNTTLDQALDELARQGIGLHPALRKGFSNLYGYTSTADGIRHALMEQETLDHEDAKYMLVSCSASINYVIAKAQKAGLELGKRPEQPSS